MDAESKVEVVKSFAQEIVTEAELKQLFETNEHPLAYDGFEPSGLAPIHFGIMRAKNVKKLLNIGIRFNLYIADYFAFINKKVGGNLEHIQNVGKYFVEVWRAAGIDTGKVSVVWASELMKDFSYWDMFIKVGRAISLDRAKRAITIMGRQQGEAVDAAQIFYPAMQVTDIFQMDIDICQLGLDQRKANMLAREIAQKFGRKVPVAVHHPYLLGLKGAPNAGALASDEGFVYKMSKSKPGDAILVHDDFETIKNKIGNAYCPPGIVEGNPLFNYLDLLVIDDKSAPIAIERPARFGGRLELANYAELVSAYKKGQLHPTDLKAFVAEELEKLIKPVREHFEKDSKARELYELVKSYQVTR
ncbi:MAG: tyrosine--tRNA ligase [Candidatus Micrarchaeia archaeon]